MKALGCYTDGQRQEIDAADAWACPACAGLNNAQRLDRECQSCRRPHNGGQLAGVDSCATSSS
eukprot:1005073-Pelagomonas_calceolata.AAC.1